MDRDVLLQVVSLTRPAWCSSCDSFLAGLWHQGQKCAMCEMLLCHACADDAGPCLAKRVKTAELREGRLQERIRELERLLASKGGIGVACKANRDSRFNQVLKDALKVPDVQLQDYLQTSPLITCDLAMSLTQVTNCLLNESFMERVLQADSGAFDVVASHWAPAPEPQHRLRGLKYSVPIPEDVPQAVRSMLQLPSSSTCRALCRLKVTQAEIVMTLQPLSCFQDVTSPLNPFKIPLKGLFELSLELHLAEVRHRRLALQRLRARASHGCLRGIRGRLHHEALGRGALVEGSTVDCALPEEHLDSETALELSPIGPIGPETPLTSLSLRASFEASWSTR